MNLRLLIFAILALFALSACDPDAGQQEEAAPTAYEATPDRDIRATRYDIRVTYEVTRQVQAPGGLPGGNVYTYTFLYTHCDAITLFLRRPPVAQDILYVPPALLEEEQKVHSFTILAERRPVLDDEPIEKKPSDATEI
jgi:hypothetical protein